MWPVCLALVALAVYLRYLSCCIVLKWVLCIKGATQLNKILSKRPQKLRVRSVLIHLDCAFCVRLNLIFRMNWLCVLLLYRSTSTAYRRANLWFVSATRQEISLASTWETALLICWCVETKTGGRTQKCTLWHWWRWRSRTRTVPPNTQNLTVGANRTEAEKSDCSIVFPQWHLMKEEAEATVHWRTGVRKVCVRRQASIQFVHYWHFSVALKYKEFLYFKKAEALKCLDVQCFVLFVEYRCLSVSSITWDTIQKENNLAALIHAWVHICHIANLALQMKKRRIKEPFSSILHLLVGAAVHELAGKQKSLARLGPKLPPLFLFSTKSIWLLSSWLKAKDRPYHIV